MVWVVGGGWWVVGGGWWVVGFSLTFKMAFSYPWRCPRWFGKFGKDLERIRRD